MNNFEERKILKEEDDRVTAIIKLLKDEDFTNVSKRMKFATLIIELITSSNDVRVRRLIKKLGDAVKEVEVEFENNELEEHYQFVDNDEQYFKD
jgi:hypothetical protein